MNKATRKAMRLPGKHAMAAGLILMSAFAAISTVYGGSKKPNVIMFVMDDLNDWVEPLGNKQVKTPHMSRLAKLGVTFTNAHAPAIFCAPSRTSVWTGLHASTTGCYDNNVFRNEMPNHVTIQQAFKRSGYGTYGAGKLYHHRGGYVDLVDWDEYYSSSQAMRDQGWEMNPYHMDGSPLPDPHPYSPYYTKGNRKINSAGHLEWGPIANDQEEEMVDTKRTNWACDVLKRKHKDPFFLSVGLYTPHHPHYSPKKYWDLYDRDSLELPPYKADDLDDLPPKIKKKYQKRSKQHQELEKYGALKDAIHGYYSAISYADAMLGRVLDTLSKSPYKNNTIIVIWSDQGYHFGEKGNWGKHTLWKRTTHVPFIWAGKGIAKNQRVDKTVGLIDIYPTLADICNLPLDKKLDGVSLVSTLRKPSTASKRDVFIPDIKPEGYAVVNSQWRYIHYPDGTEEFYDVKADPNEWNNLASNIEYRPIMDKMQKSAPKKFAPMATSKNKLKLVVEGDSFHWEAKKGGNGKKKKKKKK